MANIIIKESWRAIMKLLPANIRYELYDAICAYQEGESVDLGDEAAAVFETFRKDMDLSRKMTELGRSGGRSTQASAQSERSKRPLQATASSDRLKQTETIIDNVISEHSSNREIVICEDSTILRTEEEKERYKREKEENRAEILPVAQVEDAVVVSADFAKFQEWIKANAPRVARMQRPFKESEFQSLQAKYGADEVAEVLKAMDNYRPLIEKNMSAYRTAIKWLDGNREKKTKDGVSNIRKVAEVVAGVNRRQEAREAAGIKGFTMYGDD